jgi:phenylalanyl-tRNA synthetase alpha chain
MDETKIIESLSPIERQVLPKIKKEDTDIDQIVDEKTDKTTILRALAFLENKKLIKQRTESKEIIDLGILGLNYTKKELPERALLSKLTKQETIPIGEIRNSCNLNENEAKVALGTLKSKALIIVTDGRVKSIAKPAEISKKFIEEQLLETLPRSLDSLEPQETLALEKLKKRKEIVEVKNVKKTIAKLTELGQTISQKNLKQDMLEQVTPKIIKSMGWKGKKFRRYDINTPVPRLYGGKKHFVNQATNYAKSIWLEMGFKEMTGNMTITGLYNFDALFTAQDHPVREEHDTFYIKDKEGKLPTDKKIISEIKRAHEGGIDGSKGWQTIWNEEDAKKVVLRTHTTPLSIQTLHKIAKNKEYPAKYFALGKCFRNETVDWSHGFEFNQTEGIVIDENANFRQLLGYLKQFFAKMGYKEVRLRPAYFPYTEPSLEIDVFHPIHKKWVELGGAGMFRPEVTIPIFGKHIPVLAWGPGFDRIIMEYFEILDLREMYKNDLNKLREMRFWNK